MLDQNLFMTFTDSLIAIMSGLQDGTLGRIPILATVFDPLGLTPLRSASCLVTHTLSTCGSAQSADWLVLLLCSVLSSLDQHWLWHSASRLDNRPPPS